MSTPIGQSPDRHDRSAGHELEAQSGPQSGLPPPAAHQLDLFEPDLIKPEFVAAWLTVEVRSALDAVGLTARLATALASENIACNVLAGYHHDHLLVPFEMADRAVAVLEALRGSRPC